MEKGVNNPHDKFFKALLSDKESAVAFLKLSLEKETLDAIFFKKTLEKGIIRLITLETKKKTCQIRSPLPMPGVVTFLYRQKSNQKTSRYKKLVSDFCNAF